MSAKEEHLSAAPAPTADAPVSTSIEWYAEGETRVVECGAVRVVVRFIGRKGRRGRIAITAPGGAVFWAVS